MALRTAAKIRQAIAGALFTMKGESVPRWTRLPESARRIAAVTPDSVLLETSRFDAKNRHSYLFLHPSAIFAADEPDEIPRVFEQIESALGRGLHAAGFLTYECGYHFEPRLHPSHRRSSLPLAWFGVYEQPLVFDHASGSYQGGEPGWAEIPSAAGEAGALAPCDALGIEHDEYCAIIARIKEHIASGETYQVNFTDEVAATTSRTALQAYELLLQHQPVAYGALLSAAGHHILSFSPELFLRIEGGKITTRPMKGTMGRGLDSAEDAEAARRLQNDPKNRSEHVMIVDLLRNDLGRICALGSVEVEDLFSVEKYETLLQMTSTVSGTLRPEIGFYEIFRGTFPSGSVTGAPKIRTMQIIRELERSARGIYTGAIGHIAPDRSCAFNVAIRTVVLDNGKLRMGVGGGIVADSDADDEYRECLLKASFLARSPRNFQLLETLLWEDGYWFLPEHLERIAASALYFNFDLDRAEVQSRLEQLAHSFEGAQRYRVRLLADALGNVTVSASELTGSQEIKRVMLSRKHTHSSDPFLRHKTTRRSLYDGEFAAARAQGFDEVFFLNEKDQVTEGAISNLFVERAGRLLTPPLGCGVLPGIFRRHLLETRENAEEAVLTVKDLESADALFVCNSLRGMQKVSLPG